METQVGHGREEEEEEANDKVCFDSDDEDDDEYNIQDFEVETLEGEEDDESSVDAGEDSDDESSVGASEETEDEEEDVVNTVCSEDTSKRVIHPSYSEPRFAMDLNINTLTPDERIARRTRARLSLADKTLDDLGVDEETMGRLLLDIGDVEEDEESSIYRKFLFDEIPEDDDDEYSAKEEEEEEDEDEEDHDDGDDGREGETSLDNSPQETMGLRTRAHMSLADKEIEELAADEDFLNSLMNDMEEAEVKAKQVDPVYQAFVRDTLWNGPALGPLPTRKHHRDVVSVNSGSRKRVRVSPPTPPPTRGLFNADQYSRLGGLLQGCVQLLVQFDRKKNSHHTVVNRLLGDIVKAGELANAGTAKSVFHIKGVNLVHDYLEGDTAFRDKLVSGGFNGTFRKDIEFDTKPLENEKGKNGRMQFTQAEDRLLLKGLRQYTVNGFDNVVKLFPCKSESQLRDRYKNQSTSRKGAPPRKNIIKDYQIWARENKYVPFTPGEKQRLSNGIAQFCENWAQISENFLPHRSALVIRRFYHDILRSCPSALKLRPNKRAIPAKMKGNWTKEEDRIILFAAQNCESITPKIWSDVAIQLPERNVQEIMSRYQNLVVVIELLRNLQG
mmetsp:Transcript_19198/g.31966  ORF Transcript_19198/g.31966 Transcript_19198/m.31966 type:complete len:615 (-) Transcript_19198:2946-4790(-)